MNPIILPAASAPELSAEALTRGSLDRTLVALAVAQVGALAVTGFSMLDHMPTATPVVAVGLLSTFAVVAVAALRDLPQRVRAWTMIAAILAEGVTALMHLAYTPAVAMTLCVGCVFARLFISSTWSRVITALTGVSIVGTGWLVLGGHIAPLAPLGYDVGEPLTWYRAAGVMAFVQALLAFAFFDQVRRLEQNLQLQLQGVEALGVEQRALEAAESARSRAERAVREVQKLDTVGRIASGIAHDHNNQLLIVMGWAEMLKRRSDRLEATTQEGLDLIAEAAREAGHLSRSLMSLGEPGLVVQGRCFPADLIESRSRSWRRLLPTNIELSLDVKACPAVPLDPAELAQVLLNLILNARDAMPGGGVIEVATRTGAGEEEARGECTVISVADGGVGMDEETQARIFRPFFSTKGTAGTGLGLARCAGVISQARGRMEVTSAPGQGSTFMLYLPRAVSSLPAERRVETSADDTPRRILLVDDQPEVLRVIEHALRSAGYEVLRAADAQQAIGLLDTDAESIDLLCTDGVMPGTPTRQLIKRFLECHPGHPVVVCSGHAPAELQERGIDLVTHAYMGKPFTGTELIERVRQLIAAHGHA